MQGRRVTNTGGVHADGGPNLASTSLRQRAEAPNSEQKPAKTAEAMWEMERKLWQQREGNGLDEPSY